MCAEHVHIARAPCRHNFEEWRFRFNGCFVVAWLRSIHGDANLTGQGLQVGMASPNTSALAQQCELIIRWASRSAGRPAGMSVGKVRLAEMCDYGYIDVGVEIHVSF